MSTKNNPGAFRCYDAALPDEPIFTILGRDPAAPATLRFWAEERRRHGKTETPDDKDRIDDALRDAGEMGRWRYANLDPFGDGTPTWKAVTLDDTELGPVRMEPDPVVYVHAERDGDEAVRVSIEWLGRITAQLVAGDISREMYAGLIEQACRSPQRRERVVPVEEAAYDAAKRDERSLRVLGAVAKGLEIIDGLGIYEMQVPLQNGLELLRKTLFDALGDATVAAVPMAEMPVVSYGQMAADFVDTPRHVGKHPALGMGYAGNQTAGERVTIDTQPSDLAHSPEVPPHRFSILHKGETYAYARGLEVNPMHLPVALDAMHKDGWNLVAIFGQPDSKHVGFIFRRAYTGGTVKVDQEPVMPPTILLDREMIHPRQGGRVSQRSDRFLAGEPLESIRAEDPPVAEAVAERFVIEYAERQPDGSCRTNRVAGATWPEWAQPCFNRGRGQMP